MNNKPYFSNDYHQGFIFASTGSFTGDSLFSLITCYKIHSNGLSVGNLSSFCREKPSAASSHRHDHQKKQLQPVRSAPDHGLADRAPQRADVINESQCYPFPVQEINYQNPSKPPSMPNQTPFRPSVPGSC